MLYWWTNCIGCCQQEPFILYIFFFFFKSISHSLSKFFSISKEASLGFQENSLLIVEPLFLLGGVTVSQVKFILLGGGFDVGTLLQLFLLLSLSFLGLGRYESVIEGLRTWKTVQNIGKVCHCMPGKEKNWGWTMSSQPKTSQGSKISD